MLAFLVAGLGAWFAAGGLTRSVWLRAWATVVWVAAPSFVTALGSGRLGALVAHAALPWVALGVLRALGVHARDEVAPALLARAPGEGHLRDPPAPPARDVRVDRRRRGRRTRAAGRGLRRAVAVARRGRRAGRGRRGGQAAPPIPRAGPRPVARPPRSLLGSRRHDLEQRRMAAPVRRSRRSRGVGLRAGVAAAARAARRRLLLVRPRRRGLGTAAQWAPWSFGVMVLVFAVAALFRSRGTGVVSAWFVAALGLAVAVVAGPSRSPWTRPGLSVAGPAQVCPWSSWRCWVRGSSVSRHHVVARGATRRAAGSGWRACAVGMLALVALAVPVASLASWTLSVTEREGAVGDLTVTTEPVVPKVGQQMQDSDREVRVLSLEQGPDSVLEYALLRGDGPQMVDSSSVVHARAIADPSFTQGALPEIVAEMASGSSAGAAADLRGLAVGAVLIPAEATPDPASARDRAELVARLDMVPGFERVTEGQAGVLWRVAPGTSETDALPGHASSSACRSRPPRTASRPSRPWSRPSCPPRTSP
ncbi:hypothetical protein NKG05_21135 [Oerskovia sp. M15]